MGGISKLASASFPGGSGTPGSNATLPRNPVTHSLVHNGLMRRRRTHSTPRSPVGWVAGVEVGDWPAPWLQPGVPGVGQPGRLQGRAARDLAPRVRVWCVASVDTDNVKYDRG